MKIKEEQLSKITKQIEILNNVTKEIGLLETNKHQLLHNIAEINKEMNDFKNELEKEYGAVNINLEDGSYTKIEPKVEEEITSNV